MKKTRKITMGVAFSCIGIGIVLCIVAVCFGGSYGYYSRNNSYTFCDSVTGVQEINIDVKFGQITIENGDSFSIEGKNLSENGLKSYVKDGTWYIKEDSDSVYGINLFGWDIPIQFLSIYYNDDDFYPKIIVTVPEGFVNDHLFVSLKAGKILANDMTAQRADFEIGAGTMEVRRFQAMERINAEVGAGKLILRNLDTQNAAFNCGIGSVNVTGKILYNLEADCGAGEINMDLDGEETDYNYDIDCGLGEIRVNDITCDFTKDKKIHHENAIGTFELECGIGSMNIKIN